jgi:hypothetical protein
MWVHFSPFSGETPGDFLAAHGQGLIKAENVSKTDCKEKQHNQNKLCGLAEQPAGLQLVGDRVTRNLGDLLIQVMGYLNLLLLLTPAEDFGAKLFLKLEVLLLPVKLDAHTLPSIH